MTTTFVFPGQGSQALGMASALSEEFSLVKDLFTEASDALGIDLWKLCQEGPIETLNQTENTQPALLVAGVAAYQAWLAKGGAEPASMAGHSLGEYTALTCAGAIPFAEAVTLVRDRGRYMQEAVPAGEGGMAAIIGLEDEQVKQVCADQAQGDVLQAVNFNAPGQVVVAGSSAAIERAVVAMKEAGAKRALPLPVSIPAHSALMSPAAERLAARLSNVNVQLPSISVLHNCNVEVASSAEQVKANLVTQLDSPVRWVESIQTLVSNGTDQFIESGPGKVLCGMIKRIDRSAAAACVDSPAGIDALLAS